MRGSTTSPSPSFSPSPGSVASSTSSTPDLPKQGRLKDVHKKYRIIEGTRRIYHGESEGILRRQEAALANLRNQNKSLQETVETYYIPNYDAQMASLHEEAAKLGELVDGEAKRLHDLELEFEKSKSMKLDLKAVQGGVHAGLERHRNALIHIQVIENRIHKAIIDLNIVDGQTRRMKRKMDELREERQFYDNIRFKLEKELQWKEKEMEKCIELCSLLYDERNDIEERYTDVLEVHGDMEAYRMWEGTQGWSVMDPEPVENFMQVEHKTEAKKAHMECSEYFRQWIELKAMANIQDILDAPEAEDIVDAVQALQRKNAGVIELMNELVVEMDTIKAQPRILQVNIRSTIPGVELRKPLALEMMMDRIAGLLKDVVFEDEEYVVLIDVMKRAVGDIFRSAGCIVDDNDVSNEKGKARLEEHLGVWYKTIDAFVDQLGKVTMARVTPHTPPQQKKT